MQTVQPIDAAILDADDLRTAMALLGELGRQVGVDRWAEHLVKGTARIFATKVSSFNDVGPSGPVRLVIEPASDALAEIQRLLGARAAEHPLVTYYRATGDRSAIRVVDLIDLATWRDSDLYREVFAPYAADHLMAIVLADTGERVAALALMRDHAFTDRERALLEQLRPHLANQLAAAHDRAVLAGLDAAIAATGVDLITVDNDLVVMEASAQARRRLRDFGAPGADRLPAGLATFVREYGAATGTQGHEPDLPAELTLSTEGGDLVVRLLSSTRVDGNLLLLEERRGPLDPAPLIALGLTSRQAEVLALVTAGMSNAQIAASLVLAPATVKKHLERIYARLGVGSRTSAAAIAVRATERGAVRG